MYFCLLLSLLSRLLLFYSLVFFLTCALTCNLWSTLGRVRVRNVLCMYIHCINQFALPCHKTGWGCPDLTLTNVEMRWALVKYIQRFDMHKCWKAVLNCGHWLGHSQPTSTTIPSTSQCAGQLINMSCECVRTRYWNVIIACSLWNTNGNVSELTMKLVIFLF